MLNLFKKKAVATVQPSKSETLFNAIEQGDIAATKAILEKDKTLLVARNPKGKNPLHFAVVKNQQDIVHYLLSLGANPKDVSGGNIPYNCLHFACKTGNPELTKLFVEKYNLNVNDGTAWWAPLHLAADTRKGDPQRTAQVLLDNGCDINQLTRNFQQTALYIACSNHHRAMARFLLQRGADGNLTSKEIYTPLMIAAQYGDLELTKILAEVGKVNLSLADGGGKTALDIAQQNNMTEVAVYLWEQGAESASSLRAAALGKLKWSRPLIDDPKPTARFSAAAITVGPQLYLYGGVGVTEGVVVKEPDNSHNSVPELVATPLRDLWVMDFDKCRHSNVTLPSGIGKLDRSRTMNGEKHGKDLAVSADGLTVESFQADDCVPAVVKAATPFRAEESLCAYFEVTILGTGPRRLVIVGITDEKFPVDKKHPGWIEDSYGFHGDDGSAFHNSGHGRLFGDRFEEGDVIGCGLNYSTGDVFFTRNGQFLGVAYHGANPKTPFYATCSFRNKGAKVRMNFGAQPFRFDFNVPTLSWKKLAPKGDPPSPNPKQCAFLHMERKNQLLYAAIARDWEYSLEIGLYDIDSSKWVDVSGEMEMKPRSVPAKSDLVLAGKYLWVFGPKVPEKPENQPNSLIAQIPTCWVLNTDVWEWSSLSPVVELNDTGLKAQREQLSNLLYLLQGDYSSARMCRVRDKLCWFSNQKILLVDPNTLAFKETPITGSSPPFTLYTIVNSEGSIVIFGGWDEVQRKQINEVFILDTDVGLWYKPHNYGSVPRPRNNHSAVFLHSTTTHFSDLHDELLEPSKEATPDAANGGESADRTKAAVVATEAKAPEKKKFVVQCFGWNGGNFMSDFDVLSMEPNNEGDELDMYFDRENSGCDVSFYFASGQTISAHRIILASRSSYFRTLFTGPQSKSPSLAVEKVPIDANYNLFYTLIQYLYSDLVDVVRIGSYYRDFVHIAKQFAPNHCERLIQEHVLTRVSASSTMGSDLKFAVCNTTFADLTFDVCGQFVRVHKVILAARSPYFQALCFGGFKQSQQQVISLPVTNLEAFELVMSYIYTKTLDFDQVGDNLIDVFLLACEYNIKQLQALLEDVMVFNLSEDNVMSLLQVADQQHAKTLITGCLRYVAENKASIEMSAENNQLVAAVLSRVQK